MEITIFVSVYSLLIGGRSSFYKFTRVVVDGIMELVERPIGSVETKVL